MLGAESIEGSFPLGASLIELSCQDHMAVPTDYVRTGSKMPDSDMIHVMAPRSPVIRKGRCRGIFYEAEEQCSCLLCDTVHNYGRYSGHFLRRPVSLWLQHRRAGGLVARVPGSIFLLFCSSYSWASGSGMRKGVLVPWRSFAWLASHERDNVVVGRS
jgi:hypothetical protein